jgi:molybdenum cofactor cytidylyltransferase
VITGLLLAAGSGRRFGPGAQKLLAILPDGRTVVQAAAANLRQACDQVIAVARRDDRLIRALDAAGCRVIINARADEGMGTSIAAGVEACREATGWLIALGDMPFVQVATIRSILAAAAVDDSIVVPAYEGRRGHPVRFAKGYEGDLLALGGDRGARNIIERHSDNLLILETLDPGVISDIDVPSDLNRG